MYSFIKLVRGRDAKKRCVAHLTPGYDSGCGIDRGSLEGAQKLNKHAPIHSSVVYCSDREDSDEIRDES